MMNDKSGHSATISFVNVNSFQQEKRQKPLEMHERKVYCVYGMK